MKKNHSKPDKIFRLAKKQINKLLKVTAVEPSSSQVLSAELVHELRVTTKKLLALLQLYRPYCSKTDINNVEKSIKEYARRYSGQRDAYVQYETLFYIIAVYNPHNDKNMESLLHYYCQAKEQADVQHLKIDIEKDFKHVQQVWKDNLKLDSKPNFARGVDVTYRKLRKMAHEAVEAKEDEIYHRCRKWVKYYLYQLQILVPKMSGKKKSYINQLTLLGKILGDLHDCYVLEQSLNELLRNLNNRKSVINDSSGINDATLLVLGWLAQKKSQDKVQCNILFENIFMTTHNSAKV